MFQLAMTVTDKTDHEKWFWSYSAVHSSISVIGKPATQVVSCQSKH